MSDQAEKRTQNIAKLLKTLHFNGPMRRRELSQKLDIRPNSVSNIVQELIAQKWIEAVHPELPRSQLQLSRTGPWALAISTDGNDVKLAQINLYGELSEPEILCTAKINPHDFMLQVEQAVTHKLNHNRAEAFLGLGISLSGIVNPDNGDVIRSINFGPWRQVALQQNLNQRLNIPVIVENDMRCMAWSHAWFDHLSETYHSSLFVGLGRGISCAMLYKGQRHSGAHHLAGEIGHIQSGHENRLCVCGKNDCLEAYVGIDSILSMAQQLFPTQMPIRFESDLLPWLDHEPRMKNLLNRVAEHLAKVLGPIVIAIDPEVVILSSEEKNFCNALIPYLEQQLQPCLLGVGLEKPKLLAFGQRQANELRGAGALIIERALLSQH